MKYSQDMLRYTGGITASPFVHSNMNDFEEGFFVSSHCLERNTSEMIRLVSETINEPLFDDIETLKVLVLMVFFPSFIFSLLYSFHFLSFFISFFSFSFSSFHPKCQTDSTQKDIALRVHMLIPISLIA